MRPAHGGTGTPEFRAWVNMRQRCENPSHPHFALYGGRGITVCERWQDFEGFRADLGQRPSATHSIDRIDNSRGYEPSNCRWATKKEQSRNTRRAHFVVVDGERVAAASVYEKHGVTRQIFWSRTHRGWDPLAAATTPPRAIAPRKAA